MTRLLHLSDLHFGRARAELTRPLLAKIAELVPDLVVVSGDFTQRARIRQFQAARAFLDRIEAPVLSVPGNHDTPLDNLWVRLVRPWSRYRKHIAQELEPVWRDPDVTVVGINSVNHYDWQRGRVKSSARARLARLSEEPGLTVAVLHHPLEHPPGVDKTPPRGARKALDTLGRAGADIVLSGHLHTARAAPFEAAPGVLFVQAGTGLSTRVRGEPNTFNLLDIHEERTTIDRYAARTDPAFDRIATESFRREGHTWVQST